ncbi:MAG: ABC transporter permease, partial [Clostridiales bacterium]|nr:ABC transporter permease [Clostridiales bacterium]
MSNIYSNIAKSNLKKNYRFYIPKILTEMGLLGCFFIMFTLAIDKELEKTTGGAYLPTIMTMGTIVLFILSFILMIYSNSFLMKQRKPEFGLYHCLGMEKRHVGKVLFHESFRSSVISLCSGIIFGIIMYKVCSLLVCKLIGTEPVTGFYYIKPASVIPPILIFIVIDILTFIFNRISIARMKPVDLIASGRKGEKEPKVKWPLLVLGLLCIGAGYYIALTVKNPVAALELFFLAVLLVIFGTYFLFVAGSIFVLKVLKKNEKFYYTARHMPSVSGLLYRMKQNAVGLASIAILATCILVMISTTLSLYTGMYKTLDDAFQAHCKVKLACYDGNGEQVYLNYDDISDLAYKAADETGFKIKNIECQELLEVTTLRDGDRFDFVESGKGDISLASIFTIVDIDTYNTLTGKDIKLNDNELIYCPITAVKDFPGRFVIDGEEYNKVSEVDTFPVTSSYVSICDVYGIVVTKDTMTKLYDKQKEVYADYASDYDRFAAITFSDRSKAIKDGFEFEEVLHREMNDYFEKNDINAYFYVDSIWEANKELLGLFGTLLFLGLVLGIIFMFATALIIYYKQISEGYEDRDRFVI